MSFLSQLNWRYATKKFDTTKKVSDENLEKIIEAIRLTPSSFGMQPYHFFIVTNPEKREAIKAAAWNQEQITTSSHLIVMCARNDFSNLRNEYFTDLLAQSAESEHPKIHAYRELVEGNRISHFTQVWARNQVYIAQGFALAACAELEIDSCPMEGFDAVAVKNILELPENLDVSVMTPIGYRATDEKPRPKFRFTKEKLFTTIA